MPYIDYRCKNEECKNEYTVFYVTQGARVEEEPEEKCPKCESKEKEQLVSKATSFILKGSGWFNKGGY